MDRPWQTSHAGHLTTMAWRLARRVGARTLAIALGVTVLVLVFQMLRAATILPGGRLPVGLLARLLLYATPAMFALTLPMGLLIGAALSLAEVRGRGELVGWRALGHTDRGLLAGVGWLAAALSVVSVVLVGWLGPMGLEGARTSLVEAWRNELLASMSPEALTPIAAGHWLSGSLRDADADRATLDAFAWRHIDTGGRATEVTADHATVVLDGAVRAQLHHARVRSADDASCTVVEAELLEMQLPMGVGGAADVVPGVETETFTALLRAEGASARLARGQLLKRATIVLLPPALLALLLTLVLRSARVATAGRGALAGLSCAAAVHLGARGAELAGRAHLAFGVATVGALVVGAVAAALWLARDDWAS